MGTEGCGIWGYRRDMGVHEGHGGNQGHRSPALPAVPIPVQELQPQILRGDHNSNTEQKFQRPTPPIKSYDAGEKSQKTKYITLLKISVLFPFNAPVKHFNQQVID